MSPWPTGEAGLANAQQILLTKLGLTGTPQTGDAGIVQLQSLLQQLLAGGGGGSGMVPPGSTGIGAFSTNGTSGLSTYSGSTGALNIPNYSAVPVGSTGIGAFTTGASGPATYSASTGALNVPVYASGTLNMQKVILGTTYASTSGATPSSVGFGISSFTALVNQAVCLDYSFMVNVSVASTYPAIGIVRGAAGAIPSAGSTIPGGDILICQTRSTGFMGVLTTVNGTFLDTSIAVNTPVSYYAVAWISSGTGNITVNANSITGLSAFEVK